LVEWNLLVYHDGMVQADCLIGYIKRLILLFDWLNEMIQDNVISYLKGVIKLMNDLILLIIMFLYL
jgi:hypothetical protein